MRTENKSAAKADNENQRVADMDSITMCVAPSDAQIESSEALSLERQYRGMSKDAIKTKLIADYAGKDVIPLKQFDCFITSYRHEGVFEDSMDDDGDEIIGGQTTELRTSPPDLTVRVHISAMATREIAVRQLRKIIDWIETDDGEILLSEV